MSRPSFSNSPSFCSSLFALSIALLSILTPSRSLMAQAPGTVEDPITLQGIVVTATPVPLPEGALAQHVSVIDGDLLRAQGITRVADALRSVTGITVVQNGSFGSQSAIFLRGGESDYVLVLVDGVPVNQPGGSLDLSGLTTENIERIEIVRGPASGLYGSDAIAGVIQIITRSGASGFASEGTIRGGSFGSTDAILDVRGGGASGSFALSVSRYDTDGLLELNNGHTSTALTGRAEIAIDEASNARVTARLLDRTFRFPTDDTGAAVDVNQSTFAEEASLAVEIDRRLGEAFDLRGLLTLHDVDSGTDDAPDGPDDTVGFYGFQSLDAMRRVSADIRANYRVSAATVFTAGAEAEHQRIRSFSESLSEFGPSVGRSDESRSNSAGYLHAVSSTGRFSMNGGVRLENNEFFGRFLSFQVGGSAALPANTRVRLAVGRAIKEPTFLEAFATGFVTGNPDLDPERSTSWEVGAEHTAGPVGIGLTYFDQSFEDLIQYTASPPQPTDPNYYNVAAADARGVELEVTAIAGPVDLKAGWTWLKTEVTDAGFQVRPGDTFVEGEQLLRRPEHQAVAAIGGSRGRIRWNLDARWTGEREDRFFPPFPAEPEPVTLPSYTVLNLGLEVVVFSPAPGRPGFDVLLRGENLGDESYEEAFGFHAPGRGVYVGGRISWRD